jgi:hypothetical protein
VILNSRNHANNEVTDFAAVAADRFGHNLPADRIAPVVSARRKR